MHFFAPSYFPTKKLPEHWQEDFGGKPFLKTAE